MHFQKQTAETEVLEVQEKIKSYYESYRSNGGAW